MSRFIAIASGKGGVGRTSLTFNLGVAMSLFGEKIVMLDLDFSYGKFGCNYRSFKP